MTSILKDKLKFQQVHPEFFQNRDEVQVSKVFFQLLLLLFFIYLFIFFHYFKSSNARVNGEFKEQDGRKKRMAKGLCVTSSTGLCCGILITPLRWFKQIKRTVSFHVTTRFNKIRRSTAMYNPHIFNGCNTTINGQRSTKTF